MNSVPFVEHSAYSFLTAPPDFSNLFRRHFERKSIRRMSFEEVDQFMMSSNGGNIFTRGLSRISRRKKKLKPIQEVFTDQDRSLQNNDFSAPSMSYERPPKLMDRLRRSLRLPRRRERSSDRQLSPQLTGGSKQEQWQPDESAVRAGSCFFNVKYLGAVEVFESRGMTVCEGALKTLRLSRRKPVKAVLYVSGDGLRVVDQGNSRGLLVDQTIEKVSFCAPDRLNERGFAYICRDGTSRRWMCHGFLASKDSKGERLSHAVGCAFAICLERKKKRDEENATCSTTNGTKSADVLNPSWNDDEPSSSSAGMATRSNLAYQSFRKHVSIEDRYLDPQSVIINEVPASNFNEEIKHICKPRPTSNPALFQRQGSLRAPEAPSSQENFKRMMSLRNDSSTSTTSSSRHFSPQKKSLYNEPIYERDEDPLGLGLSPSSSTYVNPVDNNGLNGLDLNWTNAAPLPHPTNLIGTQNGGAGDFANWPTEKSNGGLPSPLDEVQKQFEEMKTSTSRNKADEWLDDVLRVSMTMSPTSNKSSAAVTPSTSFSNYSQLENGTSSKSGPPPAHAPPPLPTKQAISNGNPSMYQP
ncbi:unnamed protein product [Caenorhabditis angaria]|uniref:PID domain-containing protein n=1 Tax=Caenorhabditis angaria TaxID=860376 RepID=A0A9P1ISJ4_9PELO|nr:unnamed protein product [Caenorhabditis angaria]